MDVKLSVRRFDPDIAAPRPYYQQYNLEIEESATVLDSLIALREEVDGTLALRCSCRSAICGSCAMRVNGSAALACKTKISQVAPANGDPIVVEPVGNMKVVKDLVVDFSPFWEKVEQVDPWLHPEGLSPDGEYVASNESMLHLAGVMACIMCGACVSDCTVLDVDENFVGPAALAKAYRFIADPRDDADEARLSKLNEYGGMWDCTRCMKCVEVCPKGVDPMGRIMSLRENAMEAGYTDTYGARHAESFTQLIERGGTLDELRLPIKTFGIFNIKEMLKLVPTGVRAQLRGKRPPMFHKAIPGIENVRRLFRKAEAKR